MKEKEEGDLLKQREADREMKVQSTNYLYRVGQKWDQASKEASNPSRGLGMDQMEISASSKLLKECVEKAKELDQGRQERLQEIKREIESGTYQISSKAIAEAMVEDGFLLN